MAHRTIRVLALASVVLACLAIGAAGAAAPAGAADKDAPAPTPEAIVLPRFTALTAGQLFDCGLAEDGRVWCWGGNVEGTLGIGSTDFVKGPVRVEGIPDRVTAISAGRVGMCALTAAGAVWCWGSNEYGQMGGAAGGNQPTPVQIPGLDGGVAALASQWDQHVCVVMQDGSARCWGGGSNSFAELGDGSNGSRSGPVTVTVTRERLVAIAAGLMHTCALTTAGGVRCWGNGLDGQLGNGESSVSRDAAVVPTGLDLGATAIASGVSDMCALLDDGSVRCWGNNDEGQLGHGTTASSAVPVEVTGLRGRAVRIGASSTGLWAHGCALADDGAAFCWGDNEHGQLGDGTMEARLVATPVRTDAIALLAVGGDHGTAVLRDGSVVTWGDGDPTVRSPFGAVPPPPDTGYRPTGPLVPAITTNIPTPADISTDPPVVGANLLLAAIAMIAFTIAIELLNRTLADSEPFLRRRLRPLGRIDRARASADALLSRRLGHGRLADALRVLGIAAFYGLVFALLDPSWDPLSVTGLWLVLSFAVACGLVGMSDDLASWATARRWGVASELGVRPGSLLAAAVSTVATRVLVLVPGVMIGTPEALEVDEEHLDSGRRGRLAAMGLGAICLLGTLAWLVTLAAGPLRTAVPGIAVLVGGVEAFLLLVFAVAVQNGFVQLLAFRNSAGRALFHLNRVAWAVALLAVTFVFWHTLVNPRGDLAAALGATNVQAFLATVGVVLAVAAVAWLVAFAARRRARAETPTSAVALAGGPGVAASQPATTAPEPANVKADLTIATADPGTTPAGVRTGPAEPVSTPELPPPCEPPPVAIEPPTAWTLMPAEESLPSERAALAAVPEPALGAEASVPGATPHPIGRPTEVVAMSAPTPVSVAPAPIASGPAAGDGRVPCPRCAEQIQPAARLCRFCGLDLGSSGAAAFAALEAGTAVGPGTLAGTGTAATAAYRPAALSVEAPVVPAAPAVPPAAPARTPGPAAAGVEFAVQVPGNRRLGGPARLTVAPDRLELDAGWVDLAADRLTTFVVSLIVVALTVPAVPILAAAADGRFHPERVQWLREVMILLPVAGVIGIGLLRRWRDRRRLPERTSCPVLAAEARATVDSATALLAAAFGSLLGAVVWLFGGTLGTGVAVALGGCMVALGVYLAAAGRTMVVVRAPLDPRRTRSVLVSLRAGDRDAAAEIVAAIREAQRQASSPEVPAR